MEPDLQIPLRTAPTAPAPNRRMLRRRAPNKLALMPPVPLPRRAEGEPRRRRPFSLSAPKPSSRSERPAFEGSKRVAERAGERWGILRPRGKRIRERATTGYNPVRSDRTLAPGPDHGAVHDDRLPRQDRAMQHANERTTAGGVRGRAGPHLPLSPSPKGGGGTQVAPAYSPSPPWGGEGRGEEGCC